MFPHSLCTRELRTTPVHCRVFICLYSSLTFLPCLSFAHLLNVYVYNCSSVNCLRLFSEWGEGETINLLIITNCPGSHHLLSQKPAGPIPTSKSRLLGFLSEGEHTSCIMSPCVPGPSLLLSSYVSRQSESDGTSWHHLVDLLWSVASRFDLTLGVPEVWPADDEHQNKLRSLWKLNPGLGSLRFWLSILDMGLKNLHFVKHTRCFSVWWFKD